MRISNWLKLVFLVPAVLGAVDTKPYEIQVVGELKASPEIQNKISEPLLDFRLPEPILRPQNCPAFSGSM